MPKDANILSVESWRKVEDYVLATNSDVVHELTFSKRQQCRPWFWPPLVTLKTAPRETKLYDKGGQAEEAQQPILGFRHGITSVGVDASHKRMKHYAKLNDLAFSTGKRIPESLLYNRYQYQISSRSLFNGYNTLRPMNSSLIPPDSKLELGFANGTLPEHGTICEPDMKVFKFLKQILVSHWERGAWCRRLEKRTKRGLLVRAVIVRK
ncbi:uncharacterized protein BDR25DRAFT_359596 [Lindgomyces ingoldianus]|uniref:Uncharacterized protein n=1 Tax=Lindgomyces ingoldianus TaxID=673940 RepID=A0ACB6QGT7_9PLEO|nr:uncharacterized protein BDR25DRAFT_359596 [Lindgomyces ingoldianus]KAF2466229.1 hypothetical protein BDR25DRAFT_359596 [Lindgomyces ingoldianus]